MRIEAFLQQSPMFAISRAARSMDALASRALAADGLNFLEGLTLAAIFFHEPELARPSQLAETLVTTRGNISHCISSLEVRGFLQRAIDPDDARSYRLALKPQGKKCAMRVIRVFDRLQAQFERSLGKKELAGTLAAIRQLEALAAGTATQ
jgi:DNA-binding MarR family transcriptional regulator